MTLPFHTPPLIQVNLHLTFNPGAVKIFSKKTNEKLRQNVARSSPINFIAKYKLCVEFSENKIEKMENFQLQFSKSEECSHLGGLMGFRMVAVQVLNRKKTVSLMI